MFAGVLGETQLVSYRHPMVKSLHYSFAELRFSSSVFIFLITHPFHFWEVTLALREQSAVMSENSV